MSCAPTAVTDEELAKALQDGGDLSVPEDFSMSSVFTDPGVNTSTDDTVSGDLLIYTIEWGII